MIVSVSFLFWKTFVGLKMVNVLIIKYALLQNGKLYRI